MLVSVLLLLLGFVMLVKGADWFVDGASGIAAKLKIPELVIGLTVVAFGTSLPELAVSVSSAIKGSAELTIGNVVGSNIMNILLILGLSAVFSPLPVNKNLKKTDFPVLLVVTCLFILFGAVDNRMDRMEGGILFIALIAYTIFLIWNGLRQNKGSNIAPMPEITAQNAQEEPKQTWYESMKQKGWFLLIITLVGLVLIVWGADVAVNAATDIATELGVSERIIGLTVVAIGTSLPELVTSVMAAIKGKSDIAVGNVVGSNIFNITLAAGLSSLIMPLPFASAFVIDSGIALGATALLSVLGYLPSGKIERWGGVLMLLGFVGYFTYLFLLPV